MAIEFDLWLSWHFICSKTDVDAYGWRRWRRAMRLSTLNFSATIFFLILFVAYGFCWRCDAMLLINFNWSIVAERKPKFKLLFTSCVSTLWMRGSQTIYVRFVFKRVETLAAQCQTGNNWTKCGQRIPYWMPTYVCRCARNVKSAPRLFATLVLAALGAIVAFAILLYFLLHTLK